MLKNVYNINFYYFYMNLIVIYPPILHYVGHKIAWIIYLYKYTVRSKLWNKVDSLYNIFDIFDIIQSLKKINQAYSLFIKWRNCEITKIYPKL